MHLRRRWHELPYVVAVLHVLVAMVTLPAAAVTFEDAGVWSEQSPASPLPTERIWHSLAELSDSNVVLFGGATKVEQVFELLPSETWVYDVDHSTWTEIDPVQSPSARVNHAMAYIGDDKAMLFGGFTDQEEPSNETWVYDLSEASWTLMNPDPSPPARGAHAMARIQGDQVLLFGGDSDGYGSNLGDTWLYDLSENTWTQMSPAEAPAARAYHAMAYLGSGWALMYGRDYTSPGDPDPFETWVFNLQDNIWYNLEENPFPGERAMPALAGLGFFCSILYGGAGGTIEDDTWFYSAESGWVEHEPVLSPGGRAGHDMATLSGDRVLLFGGQSAGDPANDTWIYQTDPVPRIIVQPTTGLVTNESGATAVFAVAAATPPETDITIPLTSSDMGEGTVPASVTLPAGSTDPVNVTVTGVADDLIDGDIAFTIVTGDPVGGGAIYDAMSSEDVANVSVTNLNTDAAGIEVLGNGTSIPNGDTTPTSADGTRFESVPRGSRVSQTFTIENGGEADLELTGSPTIALDGSSDFTVTSQPSQLVLAQGESVDFTIQCRPSGDEASVATVSIESDATDDPFTFTIRCSGTTAPEITVFGNGRIIPNGDVTPSAEEHTEFTSEAGLTVTQTFEIENSGTEELLLSGGPDYVTIDHPQFIVSRQPEREIAPGRSKTFDVTFEPDGTGTIDATLRIDNSDDDEDPYEFQIRGINPNSDGPWPNAGPDQIVGVGERVVLDGTASRALSAASTGMQNTSRGTLTYQWAFATRSENGGSPSFLIPAGSLCMRTCQGFNAPLASFVPDMEGDYTLALTVTDDQGRSATDEVTITAVWSSGSTEFRVDRIVCAPNPSSGSVTVKYEGVGVPDRVEVSIYDLTGTLVWNDTATDIASLSWNGRTSDGERASNGPYIAVVLFVGNGQIYRERQILFLHR